MSGQYNQDNVLNYLAKGNQRLIDALKSELLSDIQPPKRYGIFNSSLKIQFNCPKCIREAPKFSGGGTIVHGDQINVISMDVDVPFWLPGMYGREFNLSKLSDVYKLIEIYGVAAVKDIVNQINDPANWRYSNDCFRKPLEQHGDWHRHSVGEKDLPILEVLVNQKPADDYWLVEGPILPYEHIITIDVPGNLKEVGGFHLNRFGITGHLVAKISDLLEKYAAAGDFQKESIPLNRLLYWAVKEWKPTKVDGFENNNTVLSLVSTNYDHKAKTGVKIDIYRI